jgi:hypothetical protein
VAGNLPESVPDKNRHNLPKRNSASVSPWLTNTEGDTAAASIAIRGSVLDEFRSNSSLPAWIISNRVITIKDVIGNFSNIPG